MKDLYRLTDKVSFWLVSAWTLLILMNIGQALIYYYNSDLPYSVFWVLKFPLITFTVGLVLIYLWVIPGYHFIKKFKVIFKIPFFILHALIFQLVYITGVFFIFGQWSGTFTPELFKTAVSEFYITDFHNVMKSYIFLIAILFAFDYFKSKQQEVILRNQVESEFVKVKMEVLRNKLQPHFLFNALNSVVALIDENKKNAQKALLNLSDLLRFSVDMNPNECISLEEEINLTQKFLEIEKMRYEEQLNFSISGPLKFPVNVPAFILQPIIENSIKHGFRKMNKTLTISIEINAESGSILIKNDGSNFNVANDGVGLGIVKKRMEFHFGDKGIFELYQEGDWTVNKFKFI